MTAEVVADLFNYFVEIFAGTSVTVDRQKIDRISINIVDDCYEIIYDVDYGTFDILYKHQVNYHAQRNLSRAETIQHIAYIFHKRMTTLRQK